MNKWDQRFMDMAEMVASWSSCFKENRLIYIITEILWLF